MKVCNGCGFYVEEEHLPCPRCGEGPVIVKTRTPPQPSPPMFSKTVKWVLIGIAAVIIAAVVAVLVILNSLGPMPSFG